MKLAKDFEGTGLLVLDEYAEISIYQPIVVVGVESLQFTTGQPTGFHMILTSLGSSIGACVHIVNLLSGSGPRANVSRLPRAGDEVLIGWPEILKRGYAASSQSQVSRDAVVLTMRIGVAPVNPAQHPHQQWIAILQALKAHGLRITDLKDACDFRRSEPCSRDIPINQGWRRHTDGAERHIWPVWDTHGHETTGENCACCPQVWHFENWTLVIHNAYDGRDTRDRRQ